MATITPGLDFAVNDTPTKLTFEAQALSLVVTQLESGDLAAGTLFVKAETDSSSTDALNPNDPPGQLWIDGRGDFWVQDQAGPVKLYRYEGGWESRRYFVRPRTGSGLDGTAFRAITASANAEFEDFGRGINDSDSSGVIFEINETQLGTDDNGRYNGWLQDLGASTFARWVGRGGTKVHHIDFNASTFSTNRDFHNNLRLITLEPQPAAASITYSNQYFSADFAVNLDKYLGYVTQITTGTSRTTDVNFATNGFINRVQHFGHVYGLYMRGENNAGALTP